MTVYQTGETARFVVQFNRITDGEPFVPSGTPTITIIPPNGTPSTSNATRLGTTNYFYRDYAVASAGTYLFYGTTNDANASRANTETGEAVVGQTWIQSISTILMQTANLASGEVVFVSPLDALTNKLTLIRGDDYKVAEGRALTWSSASWVTYNLLTATSLKFRAKKKTGTTVFQKAGTVVSSTEVRVELTSAETATFDIRHGSMYYDVEATLANGDIITLVIGSLVTVADVR